LSDRPASDNRWKLFVVGGAVVVAVVIGGVLTRSSPSPDPGTSGPVASNLVSAGNLGAVDGDQALRAKLEPALSSGATRPGGTQQTALTLCGGAARKLQPQGSALAYIATADWQGTPAEVFGFNPPGAQATSSPGRPAPTRVYVLARSDCRLLVFQSFSP
jgi:hypothetical protein